MYVEVHSHGAKTMKRTIKAKFLGLYLAVLTASQTQADLLFTVTESGGNVVFNMSGSVNLNATQGFLNPGVNTSRLIFPDLGAILIGNSVLSDVYSVNVPWTPFGTGGFRVFSSSSGDRVATFVDNLKTSSFSIGVPLGYISGNPLSATGTINGASLASLGITPGLHVTTFSNNSTGVNISDTVTVNAAPEPSGFLVLTTGVAGLFVRRRRAC